ncbi:MAG: hypothetical protein GX892_00525 [Thermoanaerobacteraceae bacterium]|nr:hypothetical protein [Thermoanaerobacteraceae bacterium]
MKKLNARNQINAIAGTSIDNNQIDCVNDAQFSSLTSTNDWQSGVISAHTKNRNLTLPLGRCLPI